MTEKSGSDGNNAIRLLLLGFLAGVAFLGILFLIARSSSTPAVPIATGDLTIKYMYQRASTEMASGDIKAESIAFHPSYLVVTSNGGRSVNVFSSDRLAEFSFSKRE
jgi:hypothetical protein